MEFFKKTTNIDFIGQRRKAAVFSVILIIGSLVLLGVRGLNFGLDFTGGTLVELSYPDTVQLDQVRAILDDSEFSGAIVQHYGSSSEVLIRMAPQEGLDNAEISNRILTLLRQDGQKVEMQRIEFVGSQVGDELTESGGMAMLFVLIGILIYVAIRFQTRFALGAIVALAHDIIIALGFFSLTQINFDLSTLAALLAMIGYSLNDTIVIFDRIRENFVRMRNATAIQVCNVSINQTMSRTIMTGLTTLLVLGALFYLGGETLKGFSDILIVGVLIGTYSSIYVASTVTLALGISRKDLLPVEKEGAELPDNP